MTAPFISISDSPKF